MTSEHTTSGIAGISERHGNQLVPTPFIRSSAKDGAELKQLMEAAFPGLEGIRYIDISSGYMYRKPSPGAGGALMGGFVGSARVFG